MSKSSTTETKVDWNKWRMLKKGEEVQPGDFIDTAPDPWKDWPRWMPVEECDPSQVGEIAPDPQYIAHRRFIRPKHNADQNET